MQMIFAREMARTAGGLLWVWGLTSFGGAKTLTDPALYDGSLAKPVKLPNQPAPEPAPADGAPRDT